ncbi:beta strand repeat-containing protein [Comamonas odontotermitis]|uniref:beta strand repeat-containing protein n=1 Tax=Comamonas odontotermitis TaxID=379895 RepID=UPI00366CCCDB
MQQRRLELASAIFNIPDAGNDPSVAVNGPAINPAFIGDGIPDILVTQMGLPGLSDTFGFYDAGGNPIGTPVTAAFSTVLPVGQQQWVFYEAQSPTTEHFTLNGVRDIRILAYDFADLGITAANAAQITRFRQSLSGRSDPAFVALNLTSLPVVPPELVVTKAATPNPMAVGGTGTYTLTVGNQSLPAPTSGTIIITDTLPAGMTPTTATGTNWTCSIAGQTVTCTYVLSIAGGASAPPISIAVNVGPTVGATVTNTATASGGGDTVCPGATRCTGTVTHDVTGGGAMPELALTKTASASSMAVGSNGTYTLALANQSTLVPTSGTITVTDTLPTGMLPTAATGTGWTCNIASQTVTCTSTAVIAAGASAPAINIAVTVQPTASASVTNTATVNGGGDSTCPATARCNGSSTITITGLPKPELTLTKTASPSPMAVGGTGTYTLALANTAAVAATSGLITIVDTLPIGIVPTTATGAGWTCNIVGQVVTCSSTAVIAAGASAPNIAIAVSVGSTAGETVTNRATASGGGSSCPVGPTCTGITTHGVTGGTAAPSLLLTKTASPSPMAVGGTGTYTLALANVASTTPTNGTITITDTLPTGIVPTAAAGTGWTCTIAGQTVTCTTTQVVAAGASAPSIAITVTVGPTASETVTNRATASGGGSNCPADPGCEGPTTHLVTGGNPAPSLVLTKNASPVPMAVGGTGTYTLSLANRASVASTSGTITITDTLPVGLVPTSATGTGWTCSITGQDVTCTTTAVIAAGATAPTIAIAVNVGPTASATVTNRAIASGGGGNCPADVNCEGPTTHRVTGGLLPELTLTKTASPSPMTVGGTGTYTLSLANTATAADTNGTITIVDTLPAGIVPTAATGTGWTCTIAGQGVTCTSTAVIAAGATAPAISIAVSVGPTASATVTNSATATGGGDDGCPAATRCTGLSTHRVTGGLLPELALTKTSSPRPMVVGGTGTYTLTLANQATVASTSGTITVTDAMPTGLLPTSATGTGWACNIAGQTVTCTTTQVIAAGASAPAITIAVNVGPTASAVVTNNATVTGGGDDNCPAAARCTGTDLSTVDGGALPSLALTKASSPSPMVVGGTGTYTLTLANRATVAPSNGTITVTDEMPVGLVPTSVTGAGWTCSIAGQTVTCTTTAIIAAGASAPAITIAVNVGPTARANVTNRATASGGGGNCPADPACTGLDISTITGGVMPELALTKTASPLAVGGTGTYTLALANLAKVASTEGTVTVTDAMPNGIVPTSATGTGWTCNIAGQTVTCTTTQAIAAGASAPAITIAVAVDASASAVVTNTATATGGGDSLCPAAARCSGKVTSSVAGGVITGVPALGLPALLIMGLGLGLLGAWRRRQV